MDRERVVERVRKCFKLGNDAAATRGEIENALKFAEQLMAEYEIEMHEVEQAGGERPREVFERHKCYATGGSSVATWECWLCDVVCRAVGTVQYYRSGVEQAKTGEGLVKFDPDTNRPLGNRCVIYFYGPAADVRLACDMFDHIRYVIATCAVALHGGCYRGAGKDYAIGFVMGLEDCLKEQAQSRDAECTAIVRQSLDKVRKDGKEWLKEEEGVKLRSGSARSTVVRDGAALAQGRKMGREHGIARGGVARLTA